MICLGCRLPPRHEERRILHLTADDLLAVVVKTVSDRVAAGRVGFHSSGCNGDETGLVASGSHCERHYVEQLTAGLCMKLIEDRERRRQPLLRVGLSTEHSIDRVHRLEVDGIAVDLHHIGELFVSLHHLHCIAEDDPCLLCLGSYRVDLATLWSEDQ